MICSWLNLELTDFVKPSFYVTVFNLPSVLISHMVALGKGSAHVHWGNSYIAKAY